MGRVLETVAQFRAAIEELRRDNAELRRLLREQRALIRSQIEELTERETKESNEVQKASV